MAIVAGTDIGHFGQFSEVADGSRRARDQCLLLTKAPLSHLL